MKYVKFIQKKFNSFGGLVEEQSERKEFTKGQRPWWSTGTLAKKTRYGGEVFRE